MIKLTDLQQQTEILFDNTSYSIAEKDFGTADIKLSTSQGYKQIGETVQGRTIGTRNISLVGYCLATTEKEMLERKRLLQTVATINKDFLIIVDDTYKLQVAATSSVAFGKSYAENNKFICKFMIEATATFPFFQQINETTKEIYYQNNPCAVNNTSDCAVGLKIKLYWRDRVNPPKNPYIINKTTGEKITITYTFEMSWTDEIVINTHYGNKNAQIGYYLGTSTEEIIVSNAIPLMSSDSTFFSLEQGINKFEIGAEENGNTLGAELTYTNCFLGV